MERERPSRVEIVRALFLPPSAGAQTCPAGGRIPRGGPFQKQKRRQCPPPRIVALSLARSWWPDEVVATIAARRIVEHLRGARFHVMKRPLTERAARRELSALLSSAEPEDVVKAIAFGLRSEGGRRVLARRRATSTQLNNFRQILRTCFAHSIGTMAIRLRSFAFSLAGATFFAVLGGTTYVCPLRPVCLCSYSF